MPQQPNIIIMSCHDIGQHLNCYGVNTVNSPSIDRLAAEGVRFENSFCTAPQCSPSRASIYTGRYPHNNGVMGLCNGKWAADWDWDMNPDEQHLAGILRGAGWKTALVGFQHERLNPSPDDFDDVIQAHFCEKVAEGAIEYCRKASSEKPFYLQVGFIEPHRFFEMGGAMPDDSKGVTVPEYLVDEPSAREEFAAYQGAIKKMDAAVGRILDALEELGLAENTITIFTSDHGIPFPRAKCSLYDPGLEVPFIVRWPGGGWSGGRVQQEMIQNIDYVPTLLEAAGVAVPESVQGMSLCGLLNGGGYQPRTELYGEMTYHDYFDPRRCIRTERYKLIANFTMAPFFMDPSQMWRPKTVTKNPQDPACTYHPAIELYDLNHDPLEFVNLAGNPDYSGIKKDLLRRLMTWMQETDDPLKDGLPTGPLYKKTMSVLKESLEE